MPELHLSRQSLDVVFKLEADALGAALARRFGLPIAPILRRYPTELPIADVHLEELDTVFETADTALAHLEFQAAYRQETLLRFLQYDVALATSSGRRIVTVVIYGGRVRTAPDRLDYGAVHYQVFNVFMGELDGTAALGRIRRLLATGTALSPEDRLDLVFAPLMRHRQPAAGVVREALALAARLPEGVQQQVQAALLGLGQRFLDEATVQVLVEELMRTSVAEMILEQGLQAGRQEGLQAGRLEGEAHARREDVRLALEARFGALPATVAQRLMAVQDLAALRDLFRLAVTSPTLAEVVAHLERQD